MDSIDFSWNSIEIKNRYIHGMVYLIECRCFEFFPNSLSLDAKLIIFFLYLILPSFIMKSTLNLTAYFHSLQTKKSRNNVFFSKPLKQKKKNCNRQLLSTFFLNYRRVLPNIKILYSFTDLTQYIILHLI
jgi:hypothetical protein